MGGTRTPRVHAGDVILGLDRGGVVHAGVLLQDREVLFDVADSVGQLCLVGVELVAFLLHYVQAVV